MLMRIVLTLLLISAPALAERPVFGPPPTPGTAVWYGIHWIDLSTEGAINGVRADETARLAMIADYIADDLTARGFTLMQPPPEAAQIRNPTHSNGEDVKLARDKGAEYAISGEVHKVSNLILSVNLYVRDAQTGRDVRAGAVDIRGNTDESYRHGYRYLLKNIIFRKEN